MSSSVLGANRMAGLSSGFDYQSIVEDMMKAASVPKNRLEQRKQLLEWKQTDLQAINTSLLSLYNETFSLKLGSTFTARTTNSTNTNVVTATAKAGTQTGTYDVVVNKLASVATNQTFSSLSKGVVLGSTVSAPITITSGSNDTFEVYLEDASSPGTGSTTKITLDAGTYSTVADLATQINTKIAAGTLNGKITASATDENQIKLVAAANSTTGYVPAFRVGYETSGAGPVYTGNNGLAALGLSQEGMVQGTALTAPINTTGANKFIISYGGDEFTISLTEKEYTSVSALATEIQTQVDNLMGSNVLKVSTADNKIRIGLTKGIASTSELTTLQIKDAASNSAVTKLGFSNGQTSAQANKISADTALYTQRNKFRNTIFGYASNVSATTNPFGFDGSTTTDISEHKFTMTINGESYQIDADTATLNSIMKTVNEDSETGVRMFYESTSDKISISTTEAGNTDGASGGEIVMGGGFFTSVLGIDSTKEQGGDNASFTINGLAITSQSNEYTLNGVTFNLVGKSADATTSTRITINADIDAVVTKVKAYIEKYNTTIETLNKKLSESRVLDDDKSPVMPLTDDERQQLYDSGKEDNIEIWQANARKGDLKNDNNLRTAYNELRNAASAVLSESAGKVTVSDSAGKEVTIDLTSLSQLGITTKTYKTGSSDNGKLEMLSETKLREALASNPDAVSKLFTQTASEEYVLDASGNLTYDSDGNVKTYTDTSKNGIGVRLYSSLKTAMDRITDEAGSESSYYWESELGNSIHEYDTRIYDLEDRLQTLEDRYWKQFNALESYLSQAQAQSNWLTQQFSSSSSSS